jgi:hypothetical protein
MSPDREEPVMSEEVAVEGRSPARPKRPPFITAPDIPHKNEHTKVIEKRAIGFTDEISTKLVVSEKTIVYNINGYMT